MCEKFVLSTYTIAHAKAEKWIFGSKFPGNRSTLVNSAYFRMILKALQIQLFKIKIHSSVEKNPKILGIQPIYI